MAEVVGADVYAVRRPMLDAAFAGERQWFVADYDHPARGPLSIQAEYLPQHSPDGRVGGLVILVTDVTEQRVAEKALRESEERFRRIANSAPAMMWVTRLDRTRDFVNDAYMRDKRRVVVGQPDWETPQLYSPIVELVANPTWARRWRRPSCSGR